ncbi:hypothetical protein R84B8_01116 [Treponema sp. R8-4-B8]
MNLSCQLSRWSTTLTLLYLSIEGALAHLKVRHIFTSGDFIVCYAIPTFSYTIYGYGMLIFKWDAINYFFQKFLDTSLCPGALPHLKVRRIYLEWGFYCAPRRATLFIYTASPCLIERRSADGKINLASIFHRFNLFGAGTC